MFGLVPFRPRHGPRLLVALLLTVLSVLAGRQPAGLVEASQPHWVLQPNATSADLNDVSCSSASECMAVGAQGTIIRTVNGGGTWQRIAVPSAAAPRDAAFGSVRCPAAGVCSVLAPPNVVLRTDDGGRSWRVHRIALSPVLAGLTRLACPTRAVCFAIASPSGLIDNSFDRSPAVFKTGDSGRSWQRLTIPHSVPCPGGDCYRLIHDHRTPIARVGYDLQWISCQSAASCFAGGDTFLAGISHEGGYASAVLRTRDGGTTWTLVDASFDPNIGTCPTPTICVGLWYQPGTPNSDLHLTRTTDGGTTWWSDWDSKPTGMHPILTAIACTGKTFCELAGPDGALAMLIATKLFVQISPASRDLHAVACPRVSACYAVGTSGTILTRKRYSGLQTRSERTDARYGRLAPAVYTAPEKVIKRMVHMERAAIIETFNDPVAQELLRSAIPARLAYIGTDGTPRVIPIAFYWTGREIVVCTAPTSPKARALRANPHIALTIDTERAPWTQLLVRGTVEIEVVDGIPAEYLRASEKGVPEEQWEHFAEQVRAMYPQMARITIVPTWAKVFDFSSGRVPAFLQRLAAERARRDAAIG